MGRGRPPKPAQIKTLEGNRSRTKIPKEVPAAGLPEMPDDLCEVAADHWRLTMSEVGQWGVAKRIDTPALQALCTTWARFIAADAATAADPCDKDARIARTTYLNDWNRLKSQFGMSPTDRAKLAITEQKKEDPLAKFKAVG